MTRHRWSGGIAAALGLATAAIAGPVAAQGEAHGAFNPQVRAVIQAYYPAPQHLSILDWAERIVLWNALQILALQGILDIGALVATCDGPGGSDPSCQDDVASLALRSQVLALEEACPVDLSPGERSGCLFAFYQELGSLEQVLNAKHQHFLLGLSNLWRAYANHGRPEVMRFRAIPELRRLAELDTVLLFVFHLRLKALDEQIVLLQRIERELAGQAWANEVPRGELFLLAPQMQRDWTRRQLEWLWTYKSYSLASAGWGDAFREWLELTRHGRISSAPLRLPQLDRQAVFPRPPAIPTTTVPADALRRPPSARPASPPPSTVRRGLYLVLARDSMVAKDLGPPLWVPGGRPIFLDRRDAEQAVAGSGGNPRPGRAEDPDAEGDRDDGPPPRDPPEQQSATTPPERPVNLLGMSFWADLMAEALDRLPRQRSWPLERADKWALGMRTLSAVADAAELAAAIARQDVVGSHVAVIALVGSPVGAVAMELTGFDEKLRTLEDAGYSVPAVMAYSVEVAEAMVSPLSFRRRAPYSQLVVPRGAWEPAGEAAMRNYQQALREALEDERRRSQPRWFGLPRQ